MPGFVGQATTRYGAGEAQVFGELGYGLTIGAINSLNSSVM
jgi:uncharacterized protein with beta-barrel porin domain